MLYTMNIAVYCQQLMHMFDDETLDMTETLAVFLALFYVKYLLQSSAAADAAKNDLDVLQRLESVKRRLGSDLMEAMTEQALEKLGAMWYLSDRLVPPPSLF